MIYLEEDKVKAQIRTAIRAHGPNWIDYFSLQIDADFIDAEELEWEHPPTAKKQARQQLRQEQQEREAARNAVRQHQIDIELHKNPPKPQGRPVERKVVLSKVVQNWIFKLYGREVLTYALSHELTQTEVKAKYVERGVPGWHGQHQYLSQQNRRKNV